MKILHVSKFYPPYRGGIEDVCFNIVNCLSKYEQQVLCFNNINTDTVSIVNDVKITRVGVFAEIASQPISFRFGTVLNNILKSFSPDVIHFHCPNPLVSFYLFQYLPKQVKLIIHWHSDIIGQKNIYPFFRLLERKMLARADQVLVTSFNYLNYSKPLALYKNKCVVIPNIISLDKMKMNDNDLTKVDRVKTLLKDKIVFFMGRHVPYKGVEYLIEAEKHIKSNCRILIAGYGPLTEKLKSKNNSRRIEFLGKIPDELIKVYMSAADVFAFPSITKNEAFGVVLAEAMYCKAVPVTFTIHGSGVNWVSVGGVTGLEVENRNAAKFGEAIDNVLCDEQLKFRLGENARLRVLNNFTIDQIRNKIEDIYESFK